MFLWYFAIFMLCVWVFYLHVCLCITCMSGLWAAAHILGLPWILWKLECPCRLCCLAEALLLEPSCLEPDLLPFPNWAHRRGLHTWLVLSQELSHFCELKARVRHESVTWLVRFYKSVIQLSLLTHWEHWNTNPPLRPSEGEGGWAVGVAEAPRSASDLKRSRLQLLLSGLHIGSSHLWKFDLKVCGSCFTSC